MDESGYIKLRITKGVNAALADLIKTTRSKTSISLLAEEFLQEAIDACTQAAAPIQMLPTVLKMRARMGLPIGLPLPMIRYAEPDEGAHSLRVAEHHPPPKERKQGAR